MKKMFLVVVIMLTTILSGHAQMTEGKVFYDMEFTSDDSDMAMAIMMMQGSKLKIYFQNEATRSDVHMGAAMDMTTIVNENSKEVLMLMSMPMMGIKFAIPSTTDELNKNNEEAEDNKLDIRLINEKKEILGYKCKKAIGTDKDGNEAYFWYTEEIEVNKKGQGYLREEVPGYPLEYEIMQNGMKVKITATKFEKSLSEDEVKQLFSMEIPEGYEVKTMEDLEQMGGGM